jgi:hypothetical protein
MAEANPTFIIARVLGASSSAFLSGENVPPLGCHYIQINDTRFRI